MSKLQNIKAVLDYKIQDGLVNGLKAQSNQLINSLSALFKLVADLIKNILWLIIACIGIATSLLYLIFYPIIGYTFEPIYYGLTLNKNSIARLSESSQRKKIEKFTRKNNSDRDKSIDLEIRL